jgi:cysteinyl-tRNA synthetase
MIRLYDTARSTVVPLELRDPGKVSIYVCGPTVYAPPHLGHGRMALVYDILRRHLEWSGLDVTFVSNVTDIDDKIIDRAAAEGRDPAELATRCEGIWWRAMERIGVRRPDHIPHATDYVEQMVALIGELLDSGAAYRTSDGVYLSVEAVPGYGLLAHQSLDDLRHGGGDRELVGGEKRHPADFALWKLAKPGEPTWPSPWGDGRPGWHTECVVMSLDLLGEGFDLHTGGLDLAFPHHENERAQAVAAGRDFARHWMHNGFVELEGHKMSKSLGNIENLLDLADSYDPRTYRLLVLQAHYRSPIEVTTTTLDHAAAAVRKLDAFARRTASLPAVDPAADGLEAFRAAMDDDLDTPRATGLLFTRVGEANAALDAGDTDRAARLAAAARTMAAVLGLELVAGGEAEVPAEVHEQLARRQAARAERDFATADAIRDELAADGWIIEDGPEGPVARRA